MINAPRYTEAVRLNYICLFYAFTKLLSFFLVEIPENYPLNKPVCNIQVSDKRELGFTYKFYQSSLETVFKTSEDGIVYLKKRLNEEQIKSHEMDFATCHAM